MLPLWAQHVGLSPAQTSIVFGIASAVDMVLFYPSGKVMDRWGRLAIAIPSMVVMAVGMFLLVLTHGIVALTIVAMLMSFGNGIGSGIMQTIGADAAPDEGRRPFLGIWRLYGDTGQAVGPLIVSVVAGVAHAGLGDRLGRLHRFAGGRGPGPVGAEILLVRYTAGRQAEPAAPESARADPGRASRTATRRTGCAARRGTGCAARQ